MDILTLLRSVLFAILTVLALYCLWGIYSTVEVDDIVPPPGMNDSFGYFEKLGDPEPEPVFKEDEERALTYRLTISYKEVTTWYS